MFVPMEIEQIRKELEEKVKKISPIGKKLKFNLDGDFILIDDLHGNVSCPITFPNLKFTRIMSSYIPYARNLGIYLSLYRIFCANTIRIQVTKTFFEQTTWIVPYT